MVSGRWHSRNTRMRSRGRSRCECSTGYKGPDSALQAEIKLAAAKESYDNTTAAKRAREGRLEEVPLTMPVTACDSL